MKLLIDGTLPMEPTSGSFRYFAELVHGLDVLPAACDVTVLVTSTSRDSLTRAGEPLGEVALYEVEAVSRLRARLEKTAACVRYLKPDVVHSPAYFLPRLEVPSVVTVHDLNFVFRLTDWARSGRLLNAAHLGAYVARLAVTANHAIVPSYATMTQLRLLMPTLARRATVVPYAPFRHAKGVPPAFCDRRPLVISVGEIAAQKNIEAAIRAFAQARPYLPPDAEYILVGHDAGHYWQHRLAPLVAALQLQDCVSYEGPVSEQRLHDLYREASALTFVSRGEGYGFPAVEAMSHGLPVIGSLALAEATRGAALLVDHRDISGMASALVSLLTEKDVWTARAECGLVEARRRSWQDVARDHLGVYERTARSAT